jgi:phospholipid/cholesterol/gamma-HCH transport system permease protein
MTIDAEELGGRGDGPTDGVAAIEEWATGYAARHQLASLATVGDQYVLGVRTIQYCFVDLFTGRFKWNEFVKQGTFMAGTAVLPTILVALPIGVTLSIQFALLANQVGAASLAGAGSGLAIIRQAASLDTSKDLHGRWPPRRRENGAWWARVSSDFLGAGSPQ